LLPSYDIPMTMRKFSAVLIALIALLVTPVVQAQVGPGPHIRSELVAATPTPASGSTIDIAISMTPDAGWHGYWKNGGDAGFGMRVEWTLPAGVSIGDLAYPVPTTLTIAGLMNHVYERPYALIAPLTIAPTVAPGTRLPIRGEAAWLACTDQVCVPEFGTLSLDVVVGAAGTATARNPRFDSWRAALPQPLTSAVHYQRDGNSLRLAIPIPATLTLNNPHLFVETMRVNQPGAVQSVSRNGDMLFVSTLAGDGLQPGQSFDALLAIGNQRGLSFTATPGNVPPFASPQDMMGVVGFDTGLFLTALAGALIGGLLLNIMPCVFPILSLKALALAKAGGDPAEARREGIGYAAGTIFTCLALGVILLVLRATGEAAGWAFQLQNPASVVLLIVLTAAITANLAGLFEFGGVSFNLRPAAAGSNPMKTAFASGALAAFVATPCSGPFLGAALGATLTLPAWAALPIFGGLGLGLALPFLAIALFPRLRAMLPKPGAWMDRMRRWLALPMALTVVALVWLLGRQVGMPGWIAGAVTAAVVMVLAWIAGRQQRGGAAPHLLFLLMAALIVPVSLVLPQAATRSTAASDGPGAAQPWSPERLTAIRAEGRPALVYFTADWCVSCKVNEAAAINRSETMAAFEKANVATLVGDWTNADTAITDELARHGRNSVPLYLWYPADGGDPEILPQILTPTMLVSRAGG
jgi:DsbC/DsbD-like thiol-disulfide interchange protein/cytochrome c biogenesis protein CcdA